MRQELAKFLVDMIDEDLNPVIIDYSGRDMYGQQEKGVAVDCDAVEALSSTLAGVFGTPSFDTDDYPDVTWKDFSRIKADSLGLGFVLY